jgi:outer membrane protein TolC
MLRASRRGMAALAAMVGLAISLSGCTSLKDYVHNGFKVGPNYGTPPAPVAEHWIDANDVRVREASDDLSRWWTIFNDPVLNTLIDRAYRQNLTLRQAGFRVLEAQAQVGIAVGELFPQVQDLAGSYTHRENSLNPPISGPAFKTRSGQWTLLGNLGWELDFWGRFRRAVAAEDDLLDASVENYDDVMVTLLAGVASSYVQIRTDQQRITLLEKNVKLQEGVLNVVRQLLQAGQGKFTGIDLNQAVSNLKQTQAAIPQLRIDMRQAMDQLCILLGIPPVELEKTLDLWKEDDARKAERLQIAAKALERLLQAGDMSKESDIHQVEELWRQIGTIYIPTTPSDVAVGIPADLLRRRPDVRRAERQAAAQCEQIGIATSDLYPHFSIDGNIGFQAGHQFSYLFSRQAFTGSVGPSFRWDLLNYGRLLYNIRFQEATFQELVTVYQNTVLQANQQVEDGLVNFLQSQERTQLLAESAEAGQRAVIVALWQFKIGSTNFNQYAVIEQSLVTQEDQWAQSRGQIAQGLIQVYKALGGGWQLRLEPEASTPAVPNAAEAMPAPAPQPGQNP